MNQVSHILGEGMDTFAEKNDDYGDSWRLVGRFLYELTGGEGVTLESEEDFISFGLFTRRLDKLTRAFNGEFLADDLNFESIADSHKDEMVYAAMHASLYEHKVPQGEPAHPTVVPANANEN